MCRRFAFQDVTYADIVHCRGLLGSKETTLAHLNNFSMLRRNQIVERSQIRG